MDPAKREWKAGSSMVGAACCRGMAQCARSGIRGRRGDCSQTRHERGKARLTSQDGHPGAGEKMAIQDQRMGLPSHGNSPDMEAILVPNGLWQCVWAGRAGMAFPDMARVQRENWDCLGLGYRRVHARPDADRPNMVLTA